MNFFLCLFLSLSRTKEQSESNEHLVVFARYFYRADNATGHGEGSREDRRNGGSFLGVASMEMERSKKTS